MKPTICVLLALVFPALVLADEPTDAEAIRGTWELVSKTQLGKDVEVGKKRIEMKITADTMTFEGSPPAMYKLDPTKSPKQIDLLATVTEKKVEKNVDNPRSTTRTVLLNMRGIYEIDGDRLRICIGTNSNTGETDRPAGFDDRNSSSFVAKRISK
jgi:uncharacterized protein (TIGR03067 family)